MTECKHKQFIKNEDGKKECRKCGLLESTILSRNMGKKISDDEIICECGNRIKIDYKNKEAKSEIMDATYTTYIPFLCDKCGTYYRKIINNAIYV